MATRGCPWLSMDAHGYPRLTMTIFYEITKHYPGHQTLPMATHAIKAAPWLSMTIHGCPWLPMAAHGCPGLPMAAHGCSWLPGAAHGCTWLP